MLGNFLFSLCMLFGVSMTSAVSAGVIMAAIPAVVALLSWLFLRERIGARVWAAIACAAFGIGLLAGRAGDAVSLGFVVETERQVGRHLESHLERLPAQDAASRAIVTQMRIDEAAHADAALAAGGIELPAPVRGDLLRRFSRRVRREKQALARLVSLESGKILSEALGEVKAFAAALTVGDEPKAETLRQMALIHMEVSLDLLWRAHRK